MELEGIIGKKIGMTQVFNEEGNLIPVTVIEAGPCFVIQKKTEEKEGYNAVQLGFLEQKMQRMTKPLLGHFKKAGKGTFRVLKEFKIKNSEEFEVGQEIKVSDLFNTGDFLHVTGISKGKGFQGVIKRHGFRGGRDSHGSKVHRGPGSIGMSAYPGRVIKGKKMPGRMGNKKVTIKNLQIVDVRPEENILLVKGAVPGHINSIVYLKKQFF